MQRPVILRATELVVVEYLQREWKKPFRKTTIPQAMEAVGVPVRYENRLRIAAYLLANANASGVKAARFDPHIFLLTDDEKLLARYLVMQANENWGIPSVEDCAKALKLPPHIVTDGLRALAVVGFLRELVEGLNEYALAPNYERFLEGMGFSFHTIKISDGTAFSVGGALEALRLAQGELKNQTVKVEDACAHCTERIELVFLKGQLIREKPKGVWLLRGKDGTGSLLFLDEEHLRHYLNDHPNLKGTPAKPLRAWLRP